MSLIDQRDAFSHFRRCAEEAPDGCFEEARALSDVISEASAFLMRDLRAIGLEAVSGDAALNLEAAIYAYARASNPGESMFEAAESFGASMASPEREQVNAAAVVARDQVRRPPKAQEEKFTFTMPLHAEPPIPQHIKNAAQVLSKVY